MKFEAPFAVCDARLEKRYSDNKNSAINLIDVTLHTAFPSFLRKVCAKYVPFVSVQRYLDLSDKIAAPLPDIPQIRKLKVYFSRACNILAFLIPALVACQTAQILLNPDRDY